MNHKESEYIKGSYKCYIEETGLKLLRLAFPKLVLLNISMEYQLGPVLQNKGDQWCLRTNVDSSQALWSAIEDIHKDF